MSSRFSKIAVLTILHYYLCWQGYMRIPVQRHLKDHILLILGLHSKFFFYDSCKQQFQYVFSADSQGRSTIANCIQTITYCALIMGADVLHLLTGNRCSFRTGSRIYNDMGNQIQTCIIYAQYKEWISRNVTGNITPIPNFETLTNI